MPHRGAGTKEPHINHRWCAGLPGPLLSPLLAGPRTARFQTHLEGSHPLAGGSQGGHAGLHKPLHERPKRLLCQVAQQQREIKRLGSLRQFPAAGRLQGLGQRAGTLRQPAGQLRTKPRCEAFPRQLPHPADRVDSHLAQAGQTIPLQAQGRSWQMGQRRHLVSGGHNRTAPVPR